MRVRTFTAASLPDAMAMVRAEMGDDAVILSSRSSLKGVEVRAASERRSGAALEDISPAYSRLAALEAELERRLLSALSDPRPPTPREAAEAWTAKTVAERLAFHDIRPPLVELLLETAAKLSASPGPTALAQAFDAHLAFHPLAPELDDPVMLIGPPGAGKTACAAKLAIRAALAERQAVMISTDPSAGAASQIGLFGELARVPVETADTPDELTALVARLRAASAPPAIVIDTGGVNPFDLSDMAALRDLIDAAGVEPVLVLPAQGGRDVTDVAAAFAALGVRRLIATRLDLTRRMGGLIDAAIATGLAFAQSSDTPYIAETLAPMSPFMLARRLLSASAALSERRAS